LMRFDAGSKRFLSFLASAAADEVDFSREGRWITHVTLPDGVLWKRRTDGAQRAQLSVPPLRTELPRWSPDGKWIAFMGRESLGALWQVQVISAEGGERRRVMPTETSQGAPTWSPDGRQLMFGELLGPPGRDPKSLSIHLVDLGTGKATILDGSQGLWSARWSPDGKRVAALTADSKELMVCDFICRKWSKLATASDISDLNWSHQGDWVYFEDLLPPNGPAIFRVRVRDRKLEKVASLAGDRPIKSDWFGLTPDDSVLVSNTVETSEIYALDWDLP